MDAENDANCVRVKAAKRGGGKGETRAIGALAVRRTGRVRVVVPAGAFLRELPHRVLLHLELVHTRPRERDEQRVAAVLRQLLGLEPRVHNDLCEHHKAQL